MDMDIRYDCSGVEWATVSETLKSVGMEHSEPHVHKRAFEASYATVFVYHTGRLIGFGRAISDGAYQAAVYDVAVVPEFQKRGIGTIIMNKIMERVAGCNVILYASPGKEGFYRTLGLRKMKTGMALFTKVVSMTERGFTD
jgi:GNAT superfamily N-acetyltransferase